MNLKLPDNLDLNNPEFLNVWNLIKHTHQSVFLTGKAGTGKSTFLKYICANTVKKHVVLAPTGIAAVNVGGQTLHSFFKIPFRPLLPDDPDFSPRTIKKTLRYSKDKVKLIQELELIIVDEISMVRADIIDFIDKVLKIYSGNMREPFGGKQLLFVGDIFQLEPVITRDMRDILGRFYKQFFFFNAHVFNDLGLIPIELRKIYRQSDNVFISMLDRVRTGHPTQMDLYNLNKQCKPVEGDNDTFSMTLATRRDTVDMINSEHMDALQSEKKTFEGKVDGVFPLNDLPTALNLELKTGAQVIFIRNDKDGLWVNGTIGKISSLEDGIEIELENGVVHSVDPEVWENIQYSYDEKKKVVVENILGTFMQYPIKPAWALTVHKSQGLTFNNVVIDFAGGAFSSGQTYVALSRCTSLEGITLMHPLSERDIIVNPAIISFSHSFNNQLLVDNAIKKQESYDLYRRAGHALDHDEFSMAVSYFAQAMAINNELQSPVTQRLIAKRFMRFKKLHDEIVSLQEQVEYQKDMLRALAQEYVDMGNQSAEYGGYASEGKTSYGKAKRHNLDEISIKSALANFNKALRICPDCYDAMVGKAKLYVAIDEIDLAESEYLNALKLNENCFDAHMGLAILYRENKNITEAIKRFKKSIKVDNKRIEPHVALAEIYETLDLDDLVEFHKKAIEKIKANEKKKKQSRKKK